jgi:membrane protein
MHLVTPGFASVKKFLRIILWPASHFAQWVWRLFLAVLQRVMGNGVTGTASQFAYNTFLATVPFMFVVVTAINQSPTAYDALFEALDGTIPGITELTETFRNSTAQGAAAGLLIVFGVVAGLYLASNAIGALVDGLNRAQHLNHRPWWKSKVLNFGFALGASVLAAASTVALAGGERLVRGLSELLGASETVRDLADSLTIPVGLTTLFLFTLLVYRFGPNGIRLGYRVLLPGALLSVVTTFGLTKLIGLYADAFNNLDAVYGTLGSLFVYLTFLYFTGLMFLVGAELNAELVHRRLVRASMRDAAARASAREAPTLEVAPPVVPAVPGIGGSPSGAPTTPIVDPKHN